MAGIKPAQNVFLGRSREPKNMLLLLDAWLEFQDMIATGADIHKAAYSLALGKDPLTAALLLPVGSATYTADGTTADSVQVEQLFRAQGTMWAAQAIAIDMVETGAVSAVARVHLDWTVVPTDWFTWFASWNDLEAAPDGSLVDGERQYA